MSSLSRGSVLESNILEYSSGEAEILRNKIISHISFYKVSFQKSFALFIGLSLQDWFVEFFLYSR